MNVGWNLESVTTIAGTVGSAVVLYFFLRLDWKKFGLLYLLSAGLGVAICYALIYLKFYTFPYLLVPSLKIPVSIIVTVFPLYVLFAVRYRPQSLMHRLMFYLALVHFGVFTEAVAEKTSQIIRYNETWNLWESYGWWWIYLGAFEILGGRLIPPSLRRPLDETFATGRVGWFISHFIVIGTILLGGVELGKIIF